MYKLMKFGKRFNNKSFKTYEEARSYLRKKLRHTFPAITRHIKDNSYSELCHYNPAISSYGFSITKV